MTIDPPPPLTPAEVDASPHETPKYRNLVWQYCQGSVLDIGSQGVPVVPWAIQLDLPEPAYLKYSGGVKPETPIHIRGFAHMLPFDDGCFDTVYSSHVLEDIFEEQRPRVIAEWARVIKPGGYLTVIVPERELWRKQIEAGRIPNMAHRGEPVLGDLTRLAEGAGLRAIEERLTQLTESDYSIILISRRP